MIRSACPPRSRHRVPTLITLLAIGLSTACAVRTQPDPTSIPEPTSTPDPPTAVPTASPSPPPTWTPTATVPPVKELTICQAEEPNTLFIYGGPSRAALNVLEAVYDGPIDRCDYGCEPTILEGICDLDRGDVVLQTVHVGEGEPVVDAEGRVVELLPETRVRGAGGQEVVFGGGVISMTQTVVTFTLRADVLWADGERLSAEDSRFSYELAGQLDDAALQRRVERTASYEVKDNQTIVWTGLPGFQDSYYLLNFYHPLPGHVMGDTSVEQLLETDIARRRPLGWGPFAVEAWAEGEYITLVRNPHYFRASEGLPYLDRVTFRFVHDPRRAIDELLAGECDVVSEDLLGATVPEPLLEASADGGVRLLTAPSREWEHLDFGVQPVRWSQQVAFFGETVVRQAVAHCADRKRIAAEAFPHADTTVARSYVPDGHPLHAADGLRHWQYDPVVGRALLEEAGWRDEDEDGILEAVDVSGVTRGTVFSATLMTTQGDAARQRAAAILEENLAQCGIGLTVQYVSPDVFYADGPDGPIFGRQFDLALFSWLNGLDAPCALYLSTEIPSEANWWATSNNPGYASEAYDMACQSALDALYGTEAHTSFHQEAQRILSWDLPVLPLYFVPRVLAVRAEVEGVVLDPGQWTAFWNIESIDVGR